MTIALLGADGQLGSDIRLAAEYAGVSVVPLTHRDADITDAEGVARALEAVRPAVVINSAAFTNVEGAEDEPAIAFQVNAVGAVNVARAAAALGARCVYISTDYVFDGSKPAPADGRPDSETAYLETDRPVPLNVYGTSKLAGEHATIQAGDTNLVVRVSSLFGIAGARGKGGNFIESILKKARNGGVLTVADDQWMTPTYTPDAASAILELVKNGISGIVHVTNPRACTWHALASAAVRAAGLKVEVEAVPSSTWPTLVRRPANSALATARLTDLLGRSLRPWDDALRAYLKAKGHLS